MEMIAMLNGIPTTLDRYLTGQARSVIADSAYNANLAGLGAGPSTNPPQPQRGGWQRPGLEAGLSLTAAATLQGRPTSIMSVADQVRAKSFASQQYSNRLAGIPESPAAAVKAAQANIIASQQFNPNLAGLGEVSVNVGGEGASMSIGQKAMWAIVGGAAVFAAMKLMKK